MCTVDLLSQGWHSSIPCSYSWWVRSLLSFGTTRSFSRPMQTDRTRDGEKGGTLFRVSWERKREESSWVGLWSSLLIWAPLEPCRIAGASLAKDDLFYSPPATQQKPEAFCSECLVATITYLISNLIPHPPHPHPALSTPCPCPHRFSSPPLHQPQTASSHDDDDEFVKLFHFLFVLGEDPRFPTLFS